MKCLALFVLALLVCRAACLGGGGGGAGGGGGGFGGGGSGNNYGGGGDADLRAEKISDAALGTHEAILTASTKAGIRKAALKGSLMANAAANNAVGHTEAHNLEEADRRRLLSGPSIMGGAQTAELRSEKISDAALGTQEAIFKATDRGSIQKAVAKGTMMTAAASDPTVSHRAEHAKEAGPRRLLGEGRREDIGAMDGAMAASMAITKAVSKPSKGTIKFATTKGTDVAHAVTNPESRFTMNHVNDEPMRLHRRLLA